MKDRWKILIASTSIAIFLGLFFIFLGFSLKEIKLRQYGLLKYSFYNTIDQAQTVRQNGNYLVGLDYGFVTYPRGLLSHTFVIDVLTKDKSIIVIEGMFVGKLIQSEIINLHFAYGPDDFFQFVTVSAQEVFRESLEQFLLKQIISIRSNVNAYVQSNVCLEVESRYSWISCEHVSTGQIKNLNEKTVILSNQIAVQQLYRDAIKKTIRSQKQANVYSKGGYDIIDKVEILNSQLFKNTTQLIVQTVTNYTTDSSQVFAGATYILDNPLMPILNNEIVFKLNSEPFVQKAY